MAIGQGLVSRVVADYPYAIYLVDNFVVNTLPLPEGRVVKVTASEEAKSLERMAEVIANLRRLGAHRRTHLVAIGGGVVQDIATFSASLYMRGISWTYMPTTLLAMADSCIGGKSSINVLGYKNLVGNFYPPKDVLIDVDFTKTLTKEMLVEGLFEAGKICYARNYEAFAGYLVEASNIRLSSLQRVILRALQTKKWFIEIDEFDQKERLLLNFGHTFGHALEAGTDYALSHGIAVGLGMMVAVDYANDQSWLSTTGKEHASVLAAHVRSMIGVGNDCIVKPPVVVDLVRVMEKFENDKKHLAEAYRIVCPRHDGALELIAVPKTDQTRAGIAAAYRNALSNLAWKYAE